MTEFAPGDVVLIAIRHRSCALPSKPQVPGPCTLALQPGLQPYQDGHLQAEGASAKSSPADHLRLLELHWPYRRHLLFQEFSTTSQPQVTIPTGPKSPYPLAVRSRTSNSHRSVIEQWQFTLPDTEPIKTSKATLCATNQFFGFGRKSRHDMDRVCPSRVLKQHHTLSR